MGKRRGARESKTYRTIPLVGGNSDNTAKPIQVLVGAKVRYPALVLNFCASKNQKGRNSTSSKIDIFITLDN